jgi:DNA-directed RNA polymerase sigma subunit (sigma70/sigma32)
MGWKVTAKSGLSCYLWKIQRFPMMEPHEEYVLAKRWREHGDHEAAHKLVNSHLRLVAKIAGAMAATACRSLISSRRAVPSCRHGGRV